MCQYFRKKLKVVSRSTSLSLIQVEEVFSFFPEISYQLFTVESLGDKNKHISLMNFSSIPADFFTRELDEALINNKVDIAVHSAKDLPYPLSTELELFVLFQAMDKTDALVSKNDWNLKQLPFGSKVGTSSIKRKLELLKFRPDLKIVSIRGTIEERIAKIESGFIDALVVATCALKRLNITNRIACILPFETHALQGHLAIVGKKNRQDIKKIFCSQDVRKHYGKVTLVGFGPGNSDLLTVGGHKSLLDANIIFYDDLLDKKFLSQYTAEKIYVGKRKEMHQFHQSIINKMLYLEAIAGKKVVRLKGGDPMIFAHGREEIDFLQSHFVKVKVIPGIPAGIAFSAYTHIPLTHRGIASSVSFITGHFKKNIQVSSADTLVYYMSGANISIIAKKLIEVGRKDDLPAVLAYNVSLPDQKVWYSSLKELQYSIIRYPTPILLIIGKVVLFESKVSIHQSVLLTGTFDEADKFNEKTVHTPLIEISKIKDNRFFYSSLKRIKSFDWIIFTSRYGVRYFFESLGEMHLDIRCLSGIFLASVGKTTSLELKKYQLLPDIESKDESVEGLVDYFEKIQLVGKRILLPRSNKGLKQFSNRLKKMNNKVIDLPVYMNTINNCAKKVDLSFFKKIIFSSPSGVEAFKQIYGSLPIGIQMISKGRTTFSSVWKNSFQNESVEMLLS